MLKQEVQVLLQSETILLKGIIDILNNVMNVFVLKENEIFEISINGKNFKKSGNRTIIIEECEIEQVIFLSESTRNTVFDLFHEDLNFSNCYKLNLILDKDLSKYGKAIIVNRLLTTNFLQDNHEKIEFDLLIKIFNFHDLKLTAFLIKLFDQQLVKKMQQNGYGQNINDNTQKLENNCIKSFLEFTIHNLNSNSINNEKNLDIKENVNNQNNFNIKESINNQNCSDTRNSINSEHNENSKNNQNRLYKKNNINIRRVDYFTIKKSQIEQHFKQILQFLVESLECTSTKHFIEKNISSIIDLQVLYWIIENIENNYSINHIKFYIKYIKNDFESTEIIILKYFTLINEIYLNDELTVTQILGKNKYNEVLKKAFKHILLFESESNILIFLNILQKLILLNGEPFLNNLLTSSDGILTSNFVQRNKKMEIPYSIFNFLIFISSIRAESVISFFVHNNIIDYLFSELPKSKNVHKISIIKIIINITKNVKSITENQIIQNKKYLICLFEETRITRNMIYSLLLYLFSLSTPHFDEFFG